MGENASTGRLGLGGYPLPLLFPGGSGPSDTVLFVGIVERDVVCFALIIRPVIIAAAGRSGLAGGGGAATSALSGVDGAQGESRPCQSMMRRFYMRMRFEVQCTSQCCRMTGRFERGEGVW